MTETQIQQSTPRAMIRDKNTLKSLLDSDATKQMIKNVASKYMTEDRISKAALLALSRQPKLANCSTISFLTSMMKAAQLDLDFSGATGQAYLIPFKQECTLIVGYQGMIEVAYRSDKVAYIDAQLVYENDECVFNLGTDPRIEHTPCFDGDRGEVKFGYAVARLKGIDIPKIELMSRAEIMAIKARSMAKDFGPWKTDEHEMMRKTLIRRIFKYLPKTQEILTASEIDNMQYDYSNKIAESVKTGVEGLRDRIKSEAPETTRKHVENTPVETKVAPMSQDETEQLKAAEKKAKKKGRPPGSKNKPKVETKTETAPEQEQSSETMPDEPKWDPETIPQPGQETTPEEIQQEQPDASKLDDYKYICNKCKTKFDVPEREILCPNCYCKDIKKL